MEGEVKESSVVKSFSFIITIFILGLLILSGPVEAFSLGISISNTNPDKGDIVSFTVSLNIETGERLPLEDLRLELSGPVNINCKFLPDGTTLSGCSGITITLLSDANFTQGNLTGNYTPTGQEYSWGYGYGYGYGYSGLLENLIYNITLNTTDLDYGLYQTFFKVNIGSNQFSQTGENITIVEPINITDLPALPSCAYETDNITVSANITGSIKDVWVETNISGNLTNYTTTNLDEVCSAIVQGVGGENLEWRFVVKDIADGLTYGNWNSVYIIKRTTLTINPASPNGLNSWYTIEPIFSLENSDANVLWYRWNGNPRIEYTGPFGLENIPNPDKESAGTMKLTYFANTSCGLETWNQETFYIDLTNPLISDLIPENNSEVNNLKPSISAYLDEVYQSNSGIDESSIIMKLDNVEISPIVTDSGDLDKRLVYNPPVDLSLGEHEVYVYAKDNSGRESELTWKFNITLITGFNLTVHSPQSTTYGSKRVLFNISLNEDVEIIEYINYADTKPRWKSLCKNCDEYGFSRKRTKTLKEGGNNITIRATDYYGFTKQENINLFIDSKKPRISKTQPKRNSVVNGSEFYIKYTEDNLQKIILFYGIGTENTTKYDCPAGKNQECIFENINLSAYENQYIEYWFEVSDSINTIESRKTRVKVDTISPQLTINMPESQIGNETYERKVPFNITVSEDVTLEYIDNSENTPRWRRLASNKDEHGNTRTKTKSFKKGFHNIQIRATDKAGNSDIRDILFEVDY